jgi:DNA-binding NarL/FixJ family response regulator
VPLSEAAHAAYRSRDSVMLSMVLDGFTNKGIARELNLSPETVKSRLTLLRKRYGVHDRFTLARAWFDRHELPGD